VDRHRDDADADLDLDQAFHFEADPDPTPSFTHVGRQNFIFKFYLQQCQFTLFYLS
jgi:hypothetical protein